MTTRCSIWTPSSLSAFPARSTFAASSPYVTDAPWQRIATRSARTPRCASTKVSAALYRLPDSTRGIIARSPPVLALRPQCGQLLRDPLLADREGATVPQRRRPCGAEPRVVLGIGLRVLEVDAALQAELDDAEPDARARGLGDAMEERVVGLGLAHGFAARALGA